MNLSDLDKIQQVDAPAFLFTRIQQKIEQSKQEQMPLRVALTIAVSFVLLLGVNTFVCMKYYTVESTPENFATAIHLTSNNALYQ